MFGEHTVISSRMECASPVPLPRRTSSTVDIAQRLSSEIRRKLQTATQAKDKGAGEKLCEEVFLDLIGTVQAKAREVFRTTSHCSFFQILADHYAQAGRASYRIQLDRIRFLELDGCGTNAGSLQSHLGTFVRGRHFHAIAA